VGETVSREGGCRALPPVPKTAPSAPLSWGGLRECLVHQGVRQRPLRHLFRPMGARVRQRQKKHPP